MMLEQRIVLDTCALLWLASGDSALSSAAHEAIEHASLAFVSAISAWEISLKVARNQLKLPLPAAEWFTKVMDRHKLTLAPLDISILTQANLLPWHHKDPADRFIIATAISERAAVITADKVFCRYDIKVIG